MRDGWEMVKLGDLFERSSELLGSHDSEPAVFSVSKHDGVVLASDYFEKRVASNSLEKYKRLELDMWVYSTIHIDEGSIARNNLSFDGVVSPMYTVMRWKTNAHSPSLLEAYLRTPEMLGRFKDSAQGSINRRRSLNWNSFAAIEIPLPPLHEQRRIVDLIGAVDDAIEAAEFHCNQSIRALKAMRDQTLSRVQSNILAAGDAFDVVLGKQRVATKVEGANMIPYLRSANIQYDQINVDDVFVMHFSEKEEERLTLLHGDVLVTEGSASPAAVGVPAVWQDELEGPVGLQNAVIRFRARQGLTTQSFTKHWCFWTYDSGTFREIANGMDIKHIGKERAAILQVGVPSLKEQERISTLLDSMSLTWSAARAHADSLRNLRSNMLTVLLSGEHEIPASYDKFLKEEVAL